MKQTAKFGQFITGSVIAAILSSCAYDKHEITCGDRKYRYADVDTYFEDYSCKSCHREGGSPPLLKDSTAFRNYISSNRLAFENAIDSIGSHPMPKGDARMPDSCRTRIKVWICGGMK